MKLSIGKTRGQLYSLAKLLGDVNAVRGGPEKMFKRVLRKQAGKKAGHGLSSVFNTTFKKK